MWTITSLYFEFSVAVLFLTNLLNKALRSHHTIYTSAVTACLTQDQTRPAQSAKKYSDLREEKNNCLLFTKPKTR